MVKKFKKKYHITQHVCPLRSSYYQASAYYLFLQNIYSNLLLLKLKMEMENVSKGQQPDTEHIYSAYNKYVS